MSFSSEIFLDGTLLETHSFAMHPRAASRGERGHDGGTMTIMGSFRCGPARRYAALAGSMLVAGAICLALAGGAAVAQSGGKDAKGDAGKPAAAAAAPWDVNCISHGVKDPLMCEMSQTLAAKQTGQRVLTAAIQKKPDAGYVLKLALPHGIYLPDGVTIWVDDGAKSKFPIETADQNGSYCHADLSASLLGAMKKGAMLNVAVKSAKGDPIVLQLSLAGFSEAIDKI
jgi:invasion protein IalB